MTVPADELRKTTSILPPARSSGHFEFKSMQFRLQPVSSGCDPRYLKAGLHTPAEENSNSCQSRSRTARGGGLGMRFRSEVAEVGSTILEHPLLWRGRNGGFRRVNFPVFPYHIAYLIRGDAAVVAAVAHASRHADYWKKRLG